MNFYKGSRNIIEKYITCFKLKVFLIPYLKNYLIDAINLYFKGIKTFHESVSAIFS